MLYIFTRHPRSLGETYFQHMRNALFFGWNMVIGGLACIIHAFFPFLFQKTASNILLTMTERFINRMPVVEERVMILSRAIEKKLGTGMAKSSPFSVSMMQAHYESKSTTE